jgi:hypothetical protein
MKYPNIACSDSISHEMKINLHMLGALMVHWILCHVD